MLIFTIEQLSERIDDATVSAIFKRILSYRMIGDHVIKARNETGRL